MKKILKSKKLSRETLKATQGAGQMVCCAVSCGDPSQCVFWEQLPAECPELPYCI
ncbi:hypothetical protein [Chryseobacterium culicis]|uniref:hypothetical protein n=1 Tax=Chryseobacterium culicis TaxID=680127 RepID=UPI001874B4E6|nr:hypothetical protein [Chryseobacterium culicis]MBE4948278.1 hypothetical protein [Chryseobacterium culicis]